MDAEQDLQDLIKNIGYSEARPESPQQLRQSVFSCLNGIISFWIDVQRERKGVRKSEGRLFQLKTFGSYGLGLCHADIDVLLIAPSFVDRRDFFDELLGMLKEQPSIQHVCALEMTFVPLIRFEYHGVEVDLTLAILLSETIPDDTILLSDDFIQSFGTDKLSKIVLNGWRVCHFICTYVPDLEKFRQVCTFIKHWATRRLIYSNALGYLGGISWTILVAYVCKKYSHQLVVDYVKSFFELFAAFDWKLPIGLTESSVDGWLHTDSSVYSIQIITPCFPYQNSSFNVTNATLADIRNEIFRVNVTIGDYESGTGSSSLWETICEMRNPLAEYSDFLMVILVDTSQHNLRLWKGAVEARFRQLLNNFSNINGLQRYQIFPRTFTLRKGLKEPHCLWLIGIDHAAGAEKVRPAVESFITFLYDDISVRTSLAGKPKVKFRFDTSPRLTTLLTM